MAIIKKEMSENYQKQNQNCDWIHALDFNAQLKSIMELKQGWDDNNGNPVSKYTIERMMNFIEMFENFKQNPSFQTGDIPHIYPTNEGGIDVHYKTENYELLFDVPASEDDEITFFMDDYEKSFWIKGGFKKHFLFMDKLHKFEKITLPIKSLTV